MANTTVSNANTTGEQEMSGSIILNNSGTELKCLLCNAPFTSTICMNAHLAGKKHKKRLLLKKKEEKLAKVPPITNDPESYISQRNYTQNVSAENKLDCEICNMRMSTTYNYEVHLQSKKHKLKESKTTSYSKRFKIDPTGTKDAIKQKFIAGFVSSGTLASQPNLLNNSPFYCHKCDCRMSSSLQYQIHLSSTHHKSNCGTANADGSSYNISGIVKRTNPKIANFQTPVSQQSSNMDKMREAEMQFYQNLANDLQPPVAVAAPPPARVNVVATKRPPPQPLMQIKLFPKHHQSNLVEYPMPMKYKSSSAAYTIPSLLEYPMCTKNPYSQYNFGGLSDCKTKTPTTIATSKCNQLETS